MNMSECKSIITILDGKSGTDRLIYMAEDTRLLCIAYVEYLKRTLLPLR